MDDDLAMLRLNIGDLVSVPNITKPGRIAFLGTIAKKDGKWVGVLLDFPGGKNDGTADGVRYFDAKPLHGVFTRPKLVTVVEEASKSRTSATASPSTSTSSTSSAAAATAGRKAPPPPTPATATPPATPAKPEVPKPAARPDAKTPEPPKKEEPKTPAVPKPATATPTTTPKVEARPSATAATTTTTKKEEGGGGLKGRITELETALSAARAQIQEYQIQIAAREGAGNISGAMFEVASAQEKKVMGENEVLKEKNDALTSELKKAKSQITELEVFRPLKQKCHELETEVQKLKKQKEADDAAFGNLQLDLELCKEELLNAEEEAKAAKAQTAADLEGIIATLPTGQQEIAKLTELNRQLTAAAQKYRYDFEATKSRYETLKLETDSELEELRAKAITVDKLEEDLASHKDALEEMRTIHEASQGLEANNERLTEKIGELQTQIKDAKEQIRNLKELAATNEEVEEKLLELENQLRTELDTKTIELQEAHRQVKLKHSQLEEMNNVARNWKNLAKETEDRNHDLMAAQAANNEEKQSMRKGRQSNVRMMSQMSEVRHRTIEHLHSKLEAREQGMSYSFLRAYIPDNVAVDEGGLQLQTKVEKLFMMAAQGAKILPELYGAGSGKGDRIASRVYEICDKLVAYAHTCNKLRFVLRVCEGKQYDNMVTERDTLDHARREVEALLELAAKDDLAFDTPLDGLNVAHENVQGFIGSNFPDDPEDHSDLATYIRRGPPKINLEVQRLLLFQGAAVSKLEALADLLQSYNSPEGETVALFQRIFDQMEALQQSNKELCAKILTQSVSFEISVSNAKDHDPNMFKEDLELSFRFSRGGVLRLKELLDWVEGIVAKPTGSLTEEAPGGEDAKKKKGLISQLDSRFETEMKEGRLVAELQSIRSTLEGLNKKLERASTKVTEEFARPVWENRALEVRQELMKAAALKASLEDSTKKVELKTRELFAAKKLARDNQAMVEVLESKIAMLQSKTNEVDDLTTELERLRKKEKDLESTTEDNKKERERYTTANTALRNKNLKLKFELKRLQESRQAAPATATPGVPVKGLSSLQGANDEVSLLYRTIAVQRQQISSLRTAQGVKDLSTSLPPLASTKPMVIHAKGQHTAAENTAVDCQLQASGSPFTRQDIDKVFAFKQEYSKLSTRAQQLRAAPVLVDLNSKDTSVSDQFHASKAANDKIKADAAALEGKFGDFLAAKQSQMFRSLCGTVPTMGSSVPGASPPVVSVGPNDKLVGKVTVPLGLPKDLASKVVLRPSQLQQLHAIYVS